MLFDWGIENTDFDWSYFIKQFIIIILNLSNIYFLSNNGSHFGFQKSYTEWNVTAYASITLILFRYRKNGYQSIMFHKNEPEDRLYASRIIIQDFHRRLLFSTESSIKWLKLHLYSKFILKYISDIFTLPLI